MVHESSEQSGHLGQDYYIDTIIYVLNFESGVRQLNPESNS
jgi:hypothetical protein